ncbi:MAG: DUF3794 domain-containing protein, partial [Firmicutes bacterium]|nr:DUF3794 domain-containing protein [Bacillota bacterium]
MNFIPEYQTVRLDSIIKLGVVQVVVDTTIVPKSDAPIDRVLSISCDTIVLPSEVFAGEARFGGTAHYRVLYVDTNGGMQFLSHSVDFSDKVVNSSITQSTKSIFSSHPIDTNTIGTSSHELRLSTTVEVRLDGVLRQDVNCLVAGGDSVYVNNTTVDYSSCVYDVVDSVTVQDSVIDARAVRALGTNANAQIKSCVSGTDVVICQGIVIATVFYLTEGDILKSVLHPIPFTQEISASGVDATNNAIVSVDVKNIK